MNISKILWFLKTQVNKYKYGKVGKYSYIGKIVFIQRKKNLFIGNHVRIYPGMRVELTKKDASVWIGDNVSIGQNFHIVSYDEALYIGSNTTISGNVLISNVEHGYQTLGVHMLEQDMEKLHTKIGENCFIGYGAVILPGTILGKQCIVGANSVIKGQFSDYSVIVGSPGRCIKRYNADTHKWEKIN